MHQRLQNWGHAWRFISSIVFMCIMGFPGGSDGKVSACNAGDLGSIPGLRRSSGWEKSMAAHSGILAWRILWTGAWQATVLCA